MAPFNILVVRNFYIIIKLEYVWCHAVDSNLKETLWKEHPFDQYQSLVVANLKVQKLPFPT